MINEYITLKHGSFYSIIEIYFAYLLDKLAGSKYIVNVSEVNMSANNFDFRFEGEQLAPSTISIFSLAPFVQSFCEAVEAEGKKRGILVNTSDNNIHLLKISEGSLVLNCAGSSENVMSLVSSVVSAFSMQYPGIPSSKTIEFIKQSKKNLSHI